MHIRKANPDDASFLAKAILIAGRAHVKKGIWEVILGSTEEECLAFLQHVSITRIPHLFHYSYYLIAEETGIGPIGSLGGYNPTISGYHALQLAIPEVTKKLGIPAQNLKAAEERSKKILTCLPKQIEGAWVIDSVATISGHRGKGVATELIKKILEKGKSEGYSKVQVNMYIGNEAALNLYHKFGFEVIEENRNKYFQENIGSPGMLSLTSEL